jgi:hypothetical protein
LVIILCFLGLFLFVDGSIFKLYGGDYRMSFQTLSDLWQARYKDARGGLPDVPDVRKTEDFIRKKSESEKILKALKPLGESFLSLVKGLSPGVTNEEKVVRNVLCIPSKYLGVESISQLQPAIAKRLNDAIDETFLLGLVSHLILSNHPQRHRIPTINKDRLYSTFLRASGMADAQMQQYNKDANGIPEAVFQEQFKIDVEPILKRELKVGFWKMGKLKSNFRNLFFAGIIIGVIADTQAAKLSSGGNI